LKRLVGTLLVPVLGLGWATSARPHSLLLESTPAPGETLAAAPPTLSLRFNNRVEKVLSRLRLLDARGQARRLAVPAADGPADRLSVPLPRLAPGAYRVEWQVLSTDGHVVSGRFTFRVGP
jgi:methionine-rich copper-binding protein CopC